MYPNKTQEILLNKTFGCCRYFWNNCVATFNSYDKETNPQPTFKTVKQLRDETGWMKEVSHDSVASKRLDFEEFKKQFFKPNPKNKLGRPKFKKKGEGQSFRLDKQYVKIKGNLTHISKIGWVKFVEHNPLPPNSQIRNATYSKDSLGHYYISILVETEVKHFEKTNKSVGIDVGLKEFATLSDGTVIHNPKYFRENQSKLKRAQQHLSRKKKGSKRYKKQKLKVAKVNKEIQRQRELFLHTTSLNIVKNYDVISIETLNVSGMVKNKKLSKSISDVSWSSFFSMLKYKAEWYGKEVVQINRWEPTSKTCSSCGYYNKNLTLSIREWDCPECNTHHNRDLNASLNIQALGVSSAQRTLRECKTPLVEQASLKCIKHQ